MAYRPNRLLQVSPRLATSKHSQAMQRTIRTAKSHAGGSGLVDNSNFADWNPSLTWWKCTLANNTRYCLLLAEAFLLDTGDVVDYVDVPVNAAPNSTYYCYSWYETVEGDTCNSVLETADIALDAFYAWNPSIKEDCSNLWLNTSYCVWGDGYEDTFYPLPSQTSSTSSTHQPQQAPAALMQLSPPALRRAEFSAVARRIYCADMATKYGVSLATLYKLNPALNGDCSGLWPGYAYSIEAASA
ncbi:hypothetical protein BDV12DRAFT_199430 [Aspergillus spectabilis]